MAQTTGFNRYLAETMKEFLRPSIAKLIMTVVIFIVASYLWKMAHVVYDASFFGFPAWVMGRDEFCGPPEVDPNCGLPFYSWSGALIDMVFWYAISVLLLGLYGKVVSISSRK